MIFNALIAIALWLSKIHLKSQSPNFPIRSFFLDLIATRFLSLSFSPFRSNAHFQRFLCVWETWEALSTFWVALQWRPSRSHAPSLPAAFGSTAHKNSQHTHIKQNLSLNRREFCLKDSFSFGSSFVEPPFSGIEVCYCVNCTFSLYISNVQSVNSECTPCLRCFGRFFCKFSLNGNGGCFGGKFCKFI